MCSFYDKFSKFQAPPGIAEPSGLGFNKGEGSPTHVPPVGIVTPALGAVVPPPTIVQQGIGAGK